MGLNIATLTQVDLEKRILETHTHTPLGYILAYKSMFVFFVRKELLAFKTFPGKRIKKQLWSKKSFNLYFAHRGALTLVPVGQIIYMTYISH